MKKENTIKVLVKKPFEKATVETIDNTLEAKQSIVDGWIEFISMPGIKNVDIVLNEEGKYLGLDENLFVPEYRDVFVGNLIVVGITPDGETRSLTDSEIEYARKWIRARAF